MKTQSNNLQLTKKQTFFHYFFALALPLSLYLIAEISFVILDIKPNFRKFFLILISLFNAVFFIYFLTRQYLSLKFQTHNYSLTKGQFSQLVNVLSDKYDWIIEEDGKDYCIFTVPFKWYHWGTLMTLIHTDNQIKFNSICDLYNRPATTSFGLNKKNRQIIINELNLLTNSNNSTVEKS